MTIMMIDTSSAQFATVDGTARNVSDTMDSSQIYELTVNTNTYIKQGTGKLVTCATQANMTDGDTLTITDKGVAVVYEFDKAGDGVVAGRVQVNISTDTTAATVAARLATAIAANQAALQVTDPADGTLIIVAPSRIMTIEENVSHASFTVGLNAITPSAADGSTMIASGTTKLLHGGRGPQLGVLQVTAAGVSTLTRVGAR